MKVNTKVRYGLRTMIELGCHDGKAGVLQKDIAKTQELSEKYLDPIISSLKATGLITNIAGKKSGYILNRPAEEITVLDIFKAFEPDPAIVQCIYCPSICNRSENCVPKDYWTGLNDLITGYFKNTRLSVLVKRCKKMNKALSDSTKPNLAKSKKPVKKK